MNVIILACAALTGYLLGSISWARLIGRRFLPGADLSRQTYRGLGDDVITLEIASATNVSLQLGPRYGCAVALLDMAKVFLPTLGFRLAFPEEPYFLATAAMGVVGHNFPVFHRLRGGGGLSAVIGGLLVVDWLAVLVAPIAGMVLGMGFLRDVYAGTLLWVFLLVPWFWVRTGDWARVAYAVVLSVSFIVSMMPLTRQYLEVRKGGPEAVAAFLEQFHMGRGLMRVGRIFGLYKARKP